MRIRLCSPSARPRSDASHTVWCISDHGWRRSPTNEAGLPPLTDAQRRKAKQLFVTLSDWTGEAPFHAAGARVTAAVAEERLVLPHLQEGVYPSKLCEAAKRFCSELIGPDASLDLSSFTERMQQLWAMRGDIPPSWLNAPSAEQFALACPDGGSMDESTFIDWRCRVSRFTAAQLADATRTGGWGEPASPELVFAAATGKGKAMAAEQWAALCVRWWTVSEPWCEMASMCIF